MAKKASDGGGYKLVIVESPAKARTIQKFLDASFVVESCMGHVRDLPQKARDVPPELKATYGKMLGVDPDNGFAALYVTMRGKETVIKSLKQKLKGASELILASDEDREGEAISWHLLELLKPKVQVKRAVFHEITREAILRAFEAPREVDYNLVYAQEARRILDRLAGYTMSPLLWRKISPGLSAGRVQSVGLAMIVRRERERLAFVSADYHDLKAELTPPAAAAASFSATLVETGGKTVASGRDFDSDGALRTNQTGRGELVWLDGEAAEALLRRLQAPDISWSVSSVESKQQRRRPPVPFITSTLQQEANRKLSLSSKECMRVAQALYEAGWITYMRTDNPILSQAAKGKARECVEQLYGADTLGSETRAIKKPKGSQEAHEPIRPALTDDPAAPGGFNLKPPLQGMQLRLYDLILQRTLASVMTDALIDLTSVHVSARGPGEAPMGPPLAGFRASGMVVRSPGWMRAYQEGSDGSAGGAERGAGADSSADKELPALAEGDTLACTDLENLAHKTRAPPRYTEASFVKELEAEGIGRPSTYAQILETLKDRGYVHIEGKAICPSLTAVVVVQLLERHFKEFVDTAFTARMEAQLDRIAMGEVAKAAYLAEYYLGPDGLRNKVDMSADLIEPEDARRALLPFRFEEAAKKFSNVSVFVGPYGAYAQATAAGKAAGDGDDDGGDGEGEPRVIKANLPDAVCRDVVLLTGDTIAACLEAKQGPLNGTLLGYDESGLPVLLRVGRFGAYLQVGEVNQTADLAASPDASPPAKPRTVTLPKDVALSQVDMAMARKFMSLPRLVCQHPETGKDVLAGIGPYGPFVRHSTTYRSLAATDDVLSISGDRALELLATASKSALSSQALAVVGQLDGKNITVMKGRFGPYLKMGAVNARLPDLYQDLPEEIPLADAIEAILAKADQDPKGKKGSKAAASKTKSSASGKAAGSKIRGVAAKSTGRKAQAAPKPKARSKGLVKASSKEAPKRAKSAFIFFCAEKRSEVAAKGLSFGDITKELGLMWKGLNQEERAPYEEMSSLDKLKSKSGKPTAIPAAASAAAHKSKLQQVVKTASSAAKGAKRPRSAYLFFCSDKRQDVAAQGITFGEITKQLSAMWQELDEAQRAKYEAAAEADRARYRSELADP